MKKNVLFDFSFSATSRKQLRTAFLTLVLCFSAVMAYPQLKIVSSGNVGIDTDNPLSRLSIGTDGASTSKVYILNSATSGTQQGLVVLQVTGSGSWTIGANAQVLSGTSSSITAGIKGTSYKSSPISSGRTMGVYGVAGDATSGWNYALCGEMVGTNNGAAVFGTIPGKGQTSVNGLYAGYFRGKVYAEDLVGIKTTSPAYDLDVNGTIRCVSLIQSSDLSMKKEVKDIGKGSLDNLARIKGVKYKLKTPEELGLSTATTVASDTGKVSVPLNVLSPDHFTKEYTGFIAQDVQKVFPDLVSKDADGKLAIDYLGLIPVLVEAIKEQQAEIETLKKQVNR